MYVLFPSFPSFRPVPSSRVSFVLKSPFEPLSEVEGSLSGVVDLTWVKRHPQTGQHGGTVGK